MTLAQALDTTPETAGFLFVLGCLIFALLVVAGGVMINNHLVARKDRKARNARRENQEKK